MNKEDLQILINNNCKGKIKPIGTLTQAQRNSLGWIETCIGKIFVSYPFGGTVEVCVEETFHPQLILNSDGYIKYTSFTVSRIKEALKSANILSAIPLGFKKEINSK